MFKNASRYTIRHHQYVHGTCLRSGPICTPAAPPKPPQSLQCFQSGNQAHCQLAGVSSLRSSLFTRPTPITRREWLKNSSQYVPLRHDWRPLPPSTAISFWSASILINCQGLICIYALCDGWWVLTNLYKRVSSHEIHSGRPVNGEE